VSAAIGELTPIVGVKAACEALNIPRASFYRKRGLGVFPAAAAVRLIPRALDSAERQAVLACLHEERFQNCAPAAVTAIAAQPNADVGELGILFFQHIVASDPQSKIRVKLHSGLLKLTMRGWLGVMASGGAKVFGWMASKGLKGPSAVASALGRFRKG